MSISLGNLCPLPAALVSRGCVWDLSMWAMIFHRVILYCMHFKSWADVGPWCSGDHYMPVMDVHKRTTLFRFSSEHLVRGLSFSSPLLPSFTELRHLKSPSQTYSFFLGYPLIPTISTDADEASTRYQWMNLTFSCCRKCYFHFT